MSSYKYIACLVIYSQGIEVYFGDVSCSAIMLEVSRDRFSDTLLYGANKPLPDLSQFVTDTGKFSMPEVST